MLRSKQDSPQDDGGDGCPSEIFRGVRFLLLGFDPIEQAKVGSKLVSGGGLDVGEYGPRCTHLIVDNKILYDDSECVVARADGKAIATALWVEHCIDLGMLVDVTSILYRPVKDLNGIPGAKSLSICLTGYQRHYRDDIMRMVALMGARFSKPLVAHKVTHLICYKFEGDKYELANKFKEIKLVNHRWLEDCLRAWDILPECNYSKSGYELEIMEAEAKDSEEETEENTNRLFGANAADIVSNLNGGSGARISEGSKMPISTNQNVAAKNIFSGITEVNIKEKILASVPREAVSDNVSELHQVYRKGNEFTSLGIQAYGGANVTKESCELSPKPVTMNCDPCLDAVAPGVLSYSRKTPGRSPVSKSPGVLSSHVHKSPRGGSGKHRDKDGLEVSPPKLDLDLEGVQNVMNNSELHLEGVKSHTLPRKRKASLSNASRSEREVSAKSRACAIGSSSASPRTEGLLISTPQIQLNSCHDSSFHRNDALNPAGNHSANLIETKSLNINTRSVDHRVPISQTTLSDGTDLFSDFKILERTPERSGLGLKSKFTAEGDSGDKINGITDIQVDGKADAWKELRKSRSPVDLAVKDSKRETFARSVPLQSVAKSNLDSKSKLSAGSNRQKGSLCLGQKTINVAISKDEVKEAAHEKSVVAKLEMSGSAFKEENATKNKDTDISSGKEVENVAASEDDETEAPEEDIAAEVVNAAREDLSKPNFLETFTTDNKLDLVKNQIKRDTACTDNATVTLKNDVPEVLRGDNCKSDEVSGSILKEKIVKGKNSALSKSKNNAVSVMKKREKPGKDIEVEFENATDKENVVVKKPKVLQHPANKLEREPVPLDRTEEAINAKKDSTPVGNGNPMKGRKHLSSRSKRNPQPVLVESETTGKDKVAELQNGIEDERIKLEKAKEVHLSANECKTKSISVKKAVKRMEAEKENKPIETGPLSGNLVKQKRETVATKLKRTPMHIDNTKLKRTPMHIDKTVCVTNANSMKPIGGLKYLSPEPVWFILSGHRLQRKEFQQVIKRLKGRVCRDSHNWSYQATHFIVPDPIRRTEKFFAAAASGRWILKTDYLTASNEAGKLLPEEPYEWFKNGFNEDGGINLEAPRKWRLLRERTGHGAFYGMRIIIYGECIAPPLDTLKRVVKAGDGVILATSPPYTRFLKSGVDFAVVSPGMLCVDPWVQEFLRHEIPCVVADYLVEYVCKPGCSLERHVLFKTHAWAEKSFANLLSRSEEIVEDVAPPVESEGEGEGEDEDEDDGSAGISCQVCGSPDRAEVMLICGDEKGSLGCGVGIHIDCCDPPLEAVPEEDWFCSKCKEERNIILPTKKKTKKGSRK